MLLQMEIYVLLLDRKQERRELTAFSSKQSFCQSGIFWGDLYSPLCSPSTIKEGYQKIRILLSLRLILYFLFKATGNSENCAGLLFSLHFSIVIFHFSGREQRQRFRLLKDLSPGGSSTSVLSLCVFTYIYQKYHIQFQNINASHNNYELLLQRTYSQNQTV